MMKSNKKFKTIQSKETKLEDGILKRNYLTLLLNSS